MNPIGRQPCRRFTLLDAMILVAAAGVGLALARFAMSAFGWGMETNWPATTWANRVRLGACVALPLTFSVVLIRLRSPRPRLGRVLRQPGMVACLAVVVSLGFGLVLDLPPQWVLNEAWTESATENSFLSAFSLLGIGHSIAVAWSLLAVSRRWRPEPGWIDRLGWILGIYWLLSLMLLAWRTFIVY